MSGSLTYVITTHRHTEQTDKRTDRQRLYPGLPWIWISMDIHGYIHVWISDFNHPVDTSMDIVLSHLLIKLNI